MHTGIRNVYVDGVREDESSASERMNERSERVERAQACFGGSMNESKTTKLQPNEEKNTQRLLCAHIIDETGERKTTVSTITTEHGV